MFPDGWTIHFLFNFHIDSQLPRKWAGNTEWNTLDTLYFD